MDSRMRESIDRAVRDGLSGLRRPVDPVQVQLDELREIVRSWPAFEQLAEVSAVGADAAVEAFIQQWNEERQARTD